MMNGPDPSFSYFDADGEPDERYRSLVGLHLSDMLIFASIMPYLMWVPWARPAGPDPNCAQFGFCFCTLRI